MFQLSIDRKGENGKNNHLRHLFRTQSELINFMKLNLIENEIFHRDIGEQYKIEFTISSSESDKYDFLELEYVYAMYDNAYVFNINPEPLGKVNFVEKIFTEDEMIEKLGLKRYERYVELGLLTNPKNKEYTPFIDQELYDTIIEAKEMINYINERI